MSYENPTPVRVGMTGNFFGKKYRVAGRIVMGMEDGGDIYYWNEFNMVKEDDDEDHFTLVNENSTDGDMWRIFTMFEPTTPMTVAQASAVQVGDRVTLEEHPIRVSLVDESQVYHIEGEAPEGVEEGDIAHYFNVESANKMQVVSWTGDEVEYYRGVTIRAEAVGAAFGIQIASTQPELDPQTTQGWSSNVSTDGAGPGVAKFFSGFAGLIVFVVAILSFRSCVTSPRQSWTSYNQSYSPPYSAPAEPPPRATAPAVPEIRLGIGSVGVFDGMDFRVQGHAQVDVSRVGALFTRHEYWLTDTNDHHVLLLYGERDGSREWTLLTPIEPDAPITAQQAGALYSGAKVKLDGKEAQVGELFQSAVRTSENPAVTEQKPGTVGFGFKALAGTLAYQARWDGTNVAFHREKRLDAKIVTTAFQGAK